MRPNNHKNSFTRGFHTCTFSKFSFIRDEGYDIFGSLMGGGGCGPEKGCRLPAPLGLTPGGRSALRKPLGPLGPTIKAMRLSCGLPPKSIPMRRKCQFRVVERTQWGGDSKKGFEGLGENVTFLKKTLQMNVSHKKKPPIITRKINTSFRFV